MAEKRLKTAQINWRVEPELKAAAEKGAEAEGRTLTNLIERLLVEFLRKKGLWPPKQ